MLKKETVNRSAAPLNTTAAKETPFRVKTIEFILTCGNILFQFYLFSYRDDKVRKLIFFGSFCADKQKKKLTDKNKVVKSLKRQKDKRNK